MAALHAAGHNHCGARTLDGAASNFLVNARADGLPGIVEDR
jgi:hypothetical protein